MRKKNKIRNVKIIDSTGKIVKIKSSEVYAMVYKGQPYVATSYDFYPLSKEVDDFFFTGKIKAMVVPNVVHAFGLMGSFISSKNYYTFEMKIDHQSGDFICIRYIPEPI